MNDQPYILVDSPEGLERAATALSSSSRLYLDTEFESARGGTRLCLVQISSGAEIFLVDTIKLEQLHPLRQALARPDVQWVLHAGLQDLELLEQRVQVRAPRRLFDTQVAYALISAENNVSLAYLQYRWLGIRSDKAHQADDWVARPLPESQLRYAASDVRYLPALTEVLTKEIEAHGRLELTFEASHEALEPSREPPAPLGLESFRNAWQLGPRSQAGLRFLIEWYNALGTSEQLAAPDSKTLLSLAARMPESIEALSRIKGVSPSVAQRHGTRLVNGLSAAARQAKTTDFVPIEPMPYTTFADVRYDAWLGLLRAEICAALKVSPDHVLPARVLRELKNRLQEGRQTHLSEGLRGFRKRLLSDAMDEFCARHPPPGA